MCVDQGTALGRSGIIVKLLRERRVRVGQVIALRADQIAEYRRLHADDYAGIRDLLDRYHLHNFSIFLHEVNGHWLEFGYLEYTGDDFDGDMRTLGAEQRYVDWLAVTDAMQIPLGDVTGWAQMEQVFFHE